MPILVLHAQEMIGRIVVIVTVREPSPDSRDDIPPSYEETHVIVIPEWNGRQSLRLTRGVVGTETVLLQPAHRVSMHVAATRRCAMVEFTHRADYNGATHWSARQP